MRVGPSLVPIAYARAVQLSQMTCRVAAHRSGPTDRPVAPPDAVTGETFIRRPSRHTFDIRV
ncbi:hypothetical protein ER13_09920 [Brevundimonas sp. EAKA]|uniref:hypothetical protein n=1 Tax=Brevundimonas sp. EAKA TaxID=1495854 RepID=UPI0004A8BB2F|nr:hypothetical protein [Brevundimonas sp. EAKA]KDP94775.1 hypothetical protein ER13_09920 [Brevundimonas sp. EAKA]